MKKPAESRTWRPVSIASRRANFCSTQIGSRLKSLFQTFAPVARPPFHVHDSDNPHAIWLLQINNRIRKLRAEMSLSRWVELVKAFGVGADVLDESFDFQVEALSQIRGDLSVLTNGLGKFGIRLWMDRMPHRPAILRIRARDSSSGMPSTWRAWISSMRRLISVLQPTSISGLIPPMSFEQNSVNQFGHHVGRQVTSLFNNLIKRQRHDQTIHHSEGHSIMLLSGFTPQNAWLDPIRVHSWFLFGCTTKSPRNAK
jgi:hypothetical protein